VPHSSETARIAFGAQGLPGNASASSWSLDNVAVSALNENNPNNAFAGGAFGGELSGGSNGIGGFGGGGGFIGSNPQVFNPFIGLGYPGIGTQTGGDDGNVRFSNEPPIIPAPGAAGLLLLAGGASLRRARRR
jgi:hypothetical protein